MLRALTTLLALAVAVLLASAPAASAQTIERSCSNYLTQETAQWFFWSVGGPESDPYNFDPDRDGVACEELPCPCRYVTPDAPPAPTAPPAPAAAAPSRSTTRAPRAVTARVRVVRVVDAKTIRVRGPAGTANVRLLGLVTPSSRQCGGTSARRMLSRLARRNERIVLRTDPRTPMFDRQRRILAYVTGSDRRLMQTEMLRRGYARVSTAKPRFRRYRSFANAHRRARKARKAMWRTCGSKFARRVKR
jgi:endonuclease YncB( thermonuclease family)